MEKFDYERPELIEFSDWNGIQGSESSGTGGEGGQPGLPSPATPGGNSLPLLPPGYFSAQLPKPLDKTTFTL